MGLDISGSIINDTIVKTFSYKDIVTRGLIYYLEIAAPDSFTNGSNTIYDIIGSNAATITSAATYSSSNSGNITIGSGNYIACGNVANSSTFTICSWVKPGASQTTYADIFDNNHTGTQNWVCQQNADVQNEYGFGVNGSNTNNNRGTSLFTLTANAWVYLSFSWDGDKVKGYTNGSLFSTSAGGGALTYASPSLRLGSWGLGGRTWNGSYGNFSLYNRALADNEVLKNYNVQKTRFGL